MDDDMKAEEKKAENRPSQPSEGDERLERWTAASWQADEKESTAREAAGESGWLQLAQAMLGLAVVLFVLAAAVWLLVLAFSAVPWWAWLIVLSLVALIFR